jgi:hypothetical protein
VAEGAHVLRHPVVEGPVGDDGVGEQDLHGFRGILPGANRGGMIPGGGIIGQDRTGAG